MDIEKTKKRLARIRGYERRKHFEDGGDAKAWRGGRKQVTKNKKKEASRKACRGKHENR